jgi:EmrB/QacA subfamily drug resistance transporter
MLREQDLQSHHPALWHWSQRALTHIAEQAHHSHHAFHLPHHAHRAHHEHAAKASSPWLILFALCLGFFMTLLDTTIVSIATPRIIDGLHASLDQLLWVLNAYILVYAVLLLTAGRLGDMYGQRTLFAIGVAVFTAASALCGFAGDINQLIAGRVLQGIGGALMTPPTMAILVAVFPPERRGFAFGIWGAVAGLATIAGPSLGGFLVTYFDWRSIFFVNVPVGILTLVGTFVFVPHFRHDHDHRLDMIGVALGAVGLFGVIFGLIEGPPFRFGAFWGPVTIAEIIGIGVAVLVVFFWWESRVVKPLLPLGIFRDRNYSLMNLVGAVMEFALLGFFLPLTIYFQSILGMSPLAAGLAVMPLSTASMVLAPVAGGLADKIGGKFILLTGLVLFAVGTGWFALAATPQSTWLTFLAPLIVAGAGMGCIFAPLGAMAMQDVAAKFAGSAAGVINTTRQAGAVIGGAVVGAVLQSSLASALVGQSRTYAGQVPADSRNGFLAAFQRAAAGGLQVGPGQHVDVTQPGLTAEAEALLTRIAHDAFNHAFVLAMQPTIGLAVAIVLFAAASCLLITQRRRSGAGGKQEKGVVATAE